MTRLFFALAFALVLTPVLAAQSITSYNVRYYNVGAASPFQTQPIPAASVTCNLAATSGGTTVNPNKIEWTDPNNTGRVCRYTAGTAGEPLLSFPIGSYEGSLTAVNDAGESTESPRAAFSRADIPNRPSGVRIIR